MKIKLKYAHKYKRTQDGFMALFTDTGFIGKYNIAFWFGVNAVEDIPESLTIVVGEVEWMK